MAGKSGEGGAQLEGVHSRVQLSDVQSHGGGGGGGSATRQEAVIEMATSSDVPAPKEKAKPSFMHNNSSFRETRQRKAELVFSKCSFEVGVNAKGKKPGPCTKATGFKALLRRRPPRHMAAAASAYGTHHTST